MKRFFMPNRAGARPVPLSLPLLIALAFVLALSGCGKKPSHVDAPEDVENDTFPRIYPNPALDPGPHVPQVPIGTVSPRAP